MSIREKITEVVTNAGGRLQLWNRQTPGFEEIQVYDDGIQVEESLVPVASHSGADVIAFRGDAPQGIPVEREFKGEMRKGTLFRFERNDGQYVYRATGKVVERIDLVSGESSVVLDHSHPFASSIVRGALEVVVFFSDIPGQVDSYHDHQVLFRTPETMSYTRKGDPPHTHENSRAEVFAQALDAINRSDEAIEFRLYDSSKPTTQRQGDKSMSDSTEKVEVTREELDALKSTAKTAERTAKIVGLSAEHRTHFDSLSDEASQDAFLDLDETKRSEAVAEANKPAPTDENAVLRAEVATLREQVANSDLVNRANSEMASIEASQDLKVAILRFKDTLSDDAKTEFDGILNRSVGKTADRTAPKGEGVRSEISGLTLDKAVARAKDNDLTGAEAMEIANREVDRLHGEALVKGETNHHGMPLTRAEVYARFVDAYPDLKAAINK